MFPVPAFPRDLLAVSVVSANSKPGVQERFQLQSNTAGKRSEKCEFEYVCLQHVYFVQSPFNAALVCTRCRIVSGREGRGNVIKICQSSP